MPKFLDVPYYYGQEGNLLNLDLGEQEVQLVDGENTFNVGEYNPGRYRLKAPASISSTCSVAFSLGTYSATISFTPTMIDAINFISFEVIPMLYTASPTGSYQITFKNVCLTTTNGSSNIWSTALWGNCVLGLRAGESVAFQYMRFNNMATGSPSFAKVGLTRAINANLEQNLNTSIYAPTSPGSSSGQILISQYPNGIPTWKSISMNGESFGGNASSFYAPTTVGSNGYILKSNGSGAPSWSTPFSIMSAASISTSSLGDHCFAVFTADDENTISYGGLTGMKVIFMVKHLFVQFPVISAVGISSSGAVKYYHYDQDDFTIVGDSRTSVSSVIFSFSY